jgi:PAS domain S-box-containing protein
MTEAARGPFHETGSVADSPLLDEEILRAAIHQSSSLVIVTDVDARVVYVNRRFTEVTGYSMDEILGQNPRILQSGHTQPEVYDKLWEALMTGGSWRGEFENRRKDGTTYFAKVNISAVRSPGGDTTHYLGVQDDVTATRELEAFSRALAHDLKRHLRTAASFSEILAEDHADALDPEGRHLVSRLRSACHSMDEIIHGLSSMMYVGQAPMVRTRVDVSRLARDVVANLEAGRTEWCIAEGLFVDADRTMLRVALENLLGNAAKFTHEVACPMVRVEWDPEAGSVVVRDNGVGFSTEDAQRVFEAFVRLDGVRHIPGSGLGLATVRRVAERHGGRAWAEPGPEGADFHLRLEP